MNTYIAFDAVDAARVTADSRFRSAQPGTSGRGQPSDLVHAGKRILSSASEDAWVSLSNPGTLIVLLSNMLNQSASAVSAALPELGRQAAEEGCQSVPPENAQAIALLDEWLADATGYDHEVWPEIKRTIEENRSSYRLRFNG
jgi:hypothetical protein